MPEEHLRSSAVEGPDVRVLLADDEEMSRRGFAAALDETGGIAVVGLTRIGDDVHRLVLSCRPHVVLINAATASDWAGTVRDIVADLPLPETPKVIVVIGAEIEDYLFQAVQAGATGVLLRSMSGEELSYAVRNVAMGHSVISPAATSFMLTRLRLVAGRGGGSGSIAAIDDLSPREREILAGLAVGKSNQEIATATHLSLATVKSHVSNILIKLGVRDRVQAALLGQSAGVEELRVNNVRSYPVRVELAGAVQLGHGEPFDLSARGQRDGPLFHQHDLIKSQRELSADRRAQHDFEVSRHHGGGGRVSVHGVVADHPEGTVDLHHEHHR
jgi:DNA-binding NarL/FixJ family response regulator